jgi:transketolase
MAFALRRSSVPMDYVAVEDSFGQSAFSTGELQIAYGLTAENIAGKAASLVKEAS